MIDTDELKMKFQILDRTVEEVGGPYVEWLEFKIEATVPGFTADIKWAAMPMELQTFRDELVRMNNMVPEAKAELKGAEPGLQLLLKLGHRGQVLGEYEITDQYRNFDGPRLNGKFTIDQTFLKYIIAEIDALLTYPARKLDA